MLRYTNARTLCHCKSRVGNDELRDKYIELAIQQGVVDDTHIYFRSIQGRLDLIPPAVTDRIIKELEDTNNYLSLGRVYKELHDYRAAAVNTCKGVVEDIEQGNTFSAAFYLKEMIDDGVLDELFLLALEEARNQNDLWWQYRCLQELEWNTEAKQFLIEHQDEIAASDDPLFREELALALGDAETYIELSKEEARSISSQPFTGDQDEK